MILTMIKPANQPSHFFVHCSYFPQRKLTRQPWREFWILDPTTSARSLSPSSFQTPYTIRYDSSWLPNALRENITYSNIYSIIF